MQDSIFARHISPHMHIRDWLEIYTQAIDFEPTSPDAKQELHSLQLGYARVIIFH